VINIFVPDETDNKISKNLRLQLILFRVDCLHDEPCFRLDNSFCFVRGIPVVAVFSFDASKPCRRLLFSDKIAQIS